MNITEKQIEVLEKRFPNIRELAKTDDVQAVLDVINNFLIEKILEDGNMLDEEGAKFQLIYDQIYNQNE